MLTLQTIIKHTNITIHCYLRVYNNYTQSACRAIHVRMYICMYTYVLEEQKYLNYKHMYVHRYISKYMQFITVMDLIKALCKCTEVRNLTIIQVQ